MHIELTEFLRAFYPDLSEPIRFRGFKPRGAPDSSDNRAIEYTVTRQALLSNPAIQSQVRRENQTRGLYFVVNAGIREAKRLDLGVYAGIDRNGHEGASTQYVED